jgi:hypothetical protein
LNKELALAQLAVGGWVLTPSGVYTRNFVEEGTSVSVRLTEDTMELSLSPPIHNLEGHTEKRHAAGAMYSLAAAYGEKSGATITQTGINVAACMSEGHKQRILAVYPGSPLDWEKLCHGFRLAFDLELGHDDDAA